MHHHKSLPYKRLRVIKVEEMLIVETQKWINYRTDCLKTICDVENTNFLTPQRAFPIFGPP